MEKLASASDGDLQAFTFSQLAIWKLEMGDSKAAADLANEAAMRARSPQAHRIAGLCLHITSGGAGDAFALLFAKKFREAIPLLLAGYGKPIRPWMASCERCSRGRTLKPGQSTRRPACWTRILCRYHLASPFLLR